jgi:uncharacterized protein (DUF1501 family)
MDAMTRRKFLIASGVTGAAGLAAGVTWYPLKEIMGTAGELPPQARTLVIITLYGGNDGLNTVIPYADAAYHKARPELAYKDSEVLKLDTATGLNPALKGMHRLFGEKRVAIVRGVGYPDADRSHFRSMDIWHTAQPERPGNTGWVGRWLDSAGGDPRLAISFEPVLPPLLAGARSAGAVVGANGLRLPRTFPVNTLSALGQPVSGEPVLQARAASCFADLVSVDALIKEAKENAEEMAANGEGPRATGTGGQSALEAQLNLVTQCIEAKVATRVFSVSLGGFDTHADEKQPHQALLSMLDRSVTGFIDRMAKSEAGRKAVVMIYSEFGRRVKANASDGTDHGTASDVFLIGSGVRGGFYGEPPNLSKLDSGDLKYTIDFRDVYASLLDRLLDGDPEQTLGGWKKRIDKILR